MQTATTSTTSSHVHAGAPAESLTTLAERSFDALAALYAEARCPRSVRELEGTPKGRMLAVRAVGASPAGRILRAFATSDAFVWDGKTFLTMSDTEGTGINRVKIPLALGRQNLFPFRTLFGPSAVDGRPALVLDYDLAENPPWIRKIHDEVRACVPGLFFGPAMWKTAGGPKTLLWFGLDAR